jgi:hypothetical protein
VKDVEGVDVVEGGGHVVEEPPDVMLVKYTV